MAGIFFQSGREFTRLAALLAGLLGSGGLPAQVELPRLPDKGLIDELLDQVEGEVERLPRDADRRLGSARRQLISQLVRHNRVELERDPRGEPIVRGEVVAFSPSQEALAAARQEGFSVVRERALEGLAVRVVVLRAPEGISTRRALRRLQRLDPDGSYDFNHLYLPVAAGPAGSATEQAAVRAGLGDDALHESPGIRVGLVDGGVAADHPALREATIRMYGCDGEAVPSTHGTAVASLLVGRDDQFRGAAPGGVLYAADIYCGRVTGGAVDAFAEALAWLAREGVAVINTSIVGPSNRILEGVVRTLVERGHLIVTAVGNDGPAARPLYPAAYAGTVGITGVNARRRVLPDAGRGPHVDFAAPGADMLAAAMDGAYAEVRGTSYATPLAAGLLAAALEHPDVDAAHAALASLVASAIDLGRKGRDEIYGEGLVAESLRVAPQR